MRKDDTLNVVGCFQAHPRATSGCLQIGGSSSWDRISGISAFAEPQLYLKPHPKAKQAEVSVEDILN